ncbi:hypothetical protein EV360DRAFT_84611 [Lentinula raphanica]|nr:hypothetical protein EV360DRAFT_84611 [Lentinula raphanica]
MRSAGRALLLFLPIILILTATVASPLAKTNMVEILIALERLYTDPHTHFELWITPESTPSDLLDPKHIEAAREFWALKFEAKIPQGHPYASALPLSYHYCTQRDPHTGRWGPGVAPRKIDGNGITLGSIYVLPDNFDSLWKTLHAQFKAMAKNEIDVLYLYNLLLQPKASPKKFGLTEENLQELEGIIKRYRPYMKVMMKEGGDGSNGIANDLEKQRYSQVLTVLKNLGE